MSRRDASQQRGLEGVDSSFPGSHPGRKTWFRAHTWREDDSDGGCWFYASLPAVRGVGGRFDLEQSAGTCYWASTPLAAARERLGRPGDLVAHDEIDGAHVSSARFDPGPVANLLHRDAARRGATQELNSSAAYQVTQRWAAAFHLAGFRGVLYQPRYSTERAQALAAFGQAGRPDRSRTLQSSRPMADVLLQHGYTVLPAPRSTDLGPLLD